MKDKNIENILLIQPPVVDGSRFYEIPLNLAYLASSLIEKNYNVRVLDLQYRGFDNADEILNKSYDLIGIATYSYTIDEVKKASTTIRRLYPESVIVVGGSHASFTPFETLESLPEINYVLVGESEQNLVKLCDLINRTSFSTNEHTHELVGVVSRKTKKNNQILLPKYCDVNTLPMASHSFHLFDLKDTMEINPFIPFLISRGCPYNCFYCASPAMWTNIRVRSWESIKNELDYLLTLNIEYLNFRDDNFACLKNIHPKLLPYLKKKNIKWGCELRLDEISNEQITQFIDSGMVKARLAVETIHEKSLIKINKRWRNCSISDSISKVQFLNSVCKDVRISFMIGIPGETKQDIYETFEFAENLKPATCAFWAYSPLPGTPIYNNPSKHGITRIYPHKQLDPLFSVIETNELTNEQINELLIEAHKRFSDRTWSETQNRKSRVFL